LIPRHSSASAASSAERAYRADIDGLRALAILSVVFYHAGPAWLPGGFTGVDVFFVISGYLIGGQIYRELCNGAFSYLRFTSAAPNASFLRSTPCWSSHCWRPSCLLSPGEFTELAKEAFAATLSASNVWFWATTNYFAGNSELNPLLMTWSLGVEEQFYVVIPLMLVLMAGLRRKWILPATIAVCLLSLAIAASLAARFPMMVFYLLPARAWELGAGVALAVTELNRKSSLLSGALAQIAGFAGLALVLAPMFLLSAHSALPVPPLISSVVGTALSIAVPRCWMNRQLLSLPGLTFIGRISYSWYLWHWPLLAFMHIIGGAHLPAAAPALAVATSFAAAVLSWRFIERPFRGSLRAPAPMLMRYGLAAAALLLLYGLVGFSRGVPQRFPALAHMEAVGRALSNDPCLAGLTKNEPSLKPACVGSSPTGQAVALWGDSHSAALAPGFRSAAATQGYAFVQLGKASCPPLIGATHFIPRQPLLAAGCERFNRKALALLQADRNIRVVVLAAAWSAPLNRTWQDGWLVSDPAHESEIPTPEANCRLFVDSLKATLHALQAAGKQVIVVEDVPSFEIDLLWRVRSTRIPARRRLATWLGIQAVTDPGFAPPEPQSKPYALAASLVQPSGCRFTAGLCRTGRSHPRPVQFPHPMRLSIPKTISSTATPAISPPEGALYALRNFRLPGANVRANDKIQ
jgi:peptidoglycan/LPS O-acetylase OafA/YrhL